MTMKKELDLKGKLELEAINRIVETLKAYDEPYADLHPFVFCHDYFDGKPFEAEQPLEEYGVFKVIHRVCKYDFIKFGKDITALSNAKQVLNTFFKALGWDLLWGAKNFRNNINARATPEVNQRIITELENLLQKEDF